MEVTSRLRRSAVPFLIATAFLLLCAHSPAQSSGKTVRHHTVAESDASSPPELAQAETLIEKKDFPAAEPLLKEVTEKDSANYVAWFDLGFVYSALNRQEDAISAYRKSVVAKPDVFESNLNLGLTLAKSGQPDAEKYLRAATTLKPTANVDEGRARAWLALAHLLETANPEEAIAAYIQSSQLQPRDIEPHLSVGLLYEKANRFADAEREYKQALELNPESSDALVGLANIYTRGNRYPEAETALRKLVALRPDDGAAHAQLGRMLAASGKNDDALAELQLAAKAEPNDTPLQRDLADLYVSTAKYDQAAPLYRAMLTAQPSDPELHYALGQLLLKQRKFPESQQEFMAAVKLKPDFGAAYGDLAVAANQNKEYDLAIKATDARAKFLPEIPISYFLRATAYDHLRQYKPAAQNYHKFLETANGQYPDQEWQARHRLITIEPKK